MKSAVSIRLAHQEDMHDIWLWRNDSHTREMSLSHEEISLSNHQSWYKKALHSTSHLMYIAENKTLKIGIIHFNITENQNEWRVSINMNPQARGMGYGCPFLNEAIQRLKKDKKNIKLIAEINDTNEASLKIFSKCGFTIINKIDNICFLSTL